MTIPLPTVLPRRSSCQPGPLGRWRPCGRYPVSGTGPRARPLFGIAPGGACRAVLVAKSAVGSYPTVSPLPLRTGEVSSLWRFPWGYPRRALPGALANGSPDFPRSPVFQRFPAAIQPSARGSVRHPCDVRQLQTAQALPPMPGRCHQAALWPKAGTASERRPAASRDLCRGSQRAEGRPETGQGQRRLPRFAWGREGAGRRSSWLSCTILSLIARGHWTGFAIPWPKCRRIT